MTLDLDAFGRMIREARDRRGLRAIDLAVAMRWAGTAPVYRYERGGPDAPRPDPDTISLLAQVLGLGYADRLTLPGLAGHLPDTEPLRRDEEERLLAAMVPGLDGLDGLTDPALLFDYRGRLLAANARLLAGLDLPPGTGERWRRDGLTLIDLTWDPALGLAGRIVDPGAVRRFQVLRFMLFNRLRRHEAWFRGVPARFGHLPGFTELWTSLAERLDGDDDGVELLPVVHAPMAITGRHGSVVWYDVSQRAVHTLPGLVAVLVMSPDPAPR